MMGIHPQPEERRGDSIMAVDVGIALAIGDHSFPDLADFIFSNTNDDSDPVQPTYKRLTS